MLIALANAPFSTLIVILMTTRQMRNYTTTLIVFMEYLENTISARISENTLTSVFIVYAHINIIESKRTCIGIHAHARVRKSILFCRR